jgi:hypothetical protein
MTDKLDKETAELLRKRKNRSEIREMFRNDKELLDDLFLLNTRSLLRDKKTGYHNLFFCPLPLSLLEQEKHHEQETLYPGPEIEPPANLCRQMFRKKNQLWI